jgi:hypothetical protein
MTRGESGVSELTTQRLSFQDRAWLEDLLRTSRPTAEPLAAYSVPYHFVWQSQFNYEGGEILGHFCLVAVNEDGAFLALPPLGPDPCGPAMKLALAFLAERNRIPAMSRIENVPESLAERCKQQGYRVIPKTADYLYCREPLVSLAGDRYKSHRASHNQCLKQAGPRVRPYSPQDFEHCLAVFAGWRDNVKADDDPFPTLLAADAESAHRVALRHAVELGMTGLVAEVQGRIAAYTLGYPLDNQVFCVLLEITDRRIKGLSQYIFREFCRQLASYEFINAMDDAGLPGLRRAKESYHPVRLVSSYLVSEG